MHEREPIMEVWGLFLQPGLGAEPLVMGHVGLKLKAFELLYV